MNGVRPLREVRAEAIANAECAAIAQMLRACGWNRTQAARQLRTSYRNLLYKIERYRLAP